jgi:hypothetical protein
MTSLKGIESFCASHAIWLLPTLILILKFSLKFLISEQSQAKKFWESLLQSPVDIGFLAISLLAGSLIIHPSTGKFLLFIGLIVLISIIIALWKVSPAELNGRCIAISSGIMLINYSISLLSLIAIVNNL